MSRCWWTAGNVAAFELDLEGHKETSLFFCDPYQASQKPHCEKNHTMFRDIVPSVLALAQYTGVVGEGEVTNPDDPKGDRFYEKYVLCNPAPLTSDGMPFHGDGKPIQNTNDFPIVLRASLKEILRQYQTIESRETVIPATWKLVTLSGKTEAYLLEEYYATWKDVPREKIRWNESAWGIMPDGLRMKYQPYAYNDLSGFSFFSYLEIKDENGDFLGIQALELDRLECHRLDANTIYDVFFRGTEQELSAQKPKYWYYIDDSSSFLETKTQWADLNTVGEGIWEYDSSWKTVRPTLEKLVLDWNNSIPLVAVQSTTQEMPGVWGTYQVRAYLKSPDLSKTPTKNKWFYNESDGYFYYIGILDTGEIAPTPLNTQDPVFEDEDLILLLNKKLA